MKKTLWVIGIVALLAASVFSVAQAGSLLGPGSSGALLKPTSGGIVGSLTQQTSLYYVDLSRTDGCTQNGNILCPYAAFSTAIVSAANDPYTTGVFYLVPGNSPYVDGAPDTMPTNVYLAGNQSTWVPASGATFPGTAEIYDVTTAGNLTFSSTSTTAIHQMNNSVVASGNITANGGINFIGTIFVSPTSTLTIASTGLMNYVGGQMNALVTAAAQTNYNDMEWAGSTPGYGITQTGCANGGCMNVLGMTYINTAGNGISVNDGASLASGTINNLSFFTEILGASATSSVAAGSALTDICDSGGFYTVTGVFIAPVGTNWAPCIDEQRAVLNGMSVGTNTVVSNLTWIATPSSTFKIGVTSTWPGCIEMYDAHNTGTINYIYTSSTALVDTTVKPNFCQ